MIFRTRAILLLLIPCLFLVPGVYQTRASSQQSLSVTPPLFQLSVLPGDVWQSSVRVVNTNNFPLTVYTDVVNFVPEGEGGLGRFMPVINDSDVRATLAEWITVPGGPHVIEAGATKEVSFVVDVPKDAAPGGHFAAILTSTEPPAVDGESLALLTAQTVASLFFLRVEGDIIEQGSIREFTVLDRSIEFPEAEFSLRFENKGNVHIQPRGDIVIMNMWGKERGVIPINHNSHFGNVLPTSIRDFHFSWKGERTLGDIGRYKAIVTLGYGENGVKSSTATTYFWVIPVKGLLITLSVIAFFVFAITWMIKRYVRHMLMLAGVDPDYREETPTPRAEPETRPSTRTRSRVRSVGVPIARGAAELRSRMSTVHEFVDMVRELGRFVLQYYRFFLALIILIVGFFVLVRYVGHVSEESREYEVTIIEGDTTEVLTDEQVDEVRQ